MWEPAISGMGNTHNCAPKLQAYPPIFSLTPKASGSTRLQSCEDKVFNSRRKSIIKSRNCKHGYINAVLGVEKITNRRGSDGTTDHLENVMNLM